MGWQSDVSFSSPGCSGVEEEWEVTFFLISSQLICADVHTMAPARRQMITLHFLARSKGEEEETDYKISR